jgi:hypothetical protein
MTDYWTFTLTTWFCDSPESIIQASFFFLVFKKPNILYKRSKDLIIPLLLKIVEFTLGPFRPTASLCHPSKGYRVKKQYQTHVEKDLEASTTKKESLKFLWLFVVTEQTKDPQVTNVIAPYLTKQNLIMLIILFSLFIFYLKKNENKILQMRNTLFLSLLEFSISREIICLLSYNLIYLRGLFETQAKIIVYSIAFPGILSAFDQYFHWVPLFDNPYFMCCFFCTLGVSLAILDSLGMEISAIIEKYPQHPFSIAFSQFLLKKRKSDILARGFFTKLGTLTATGQAALFAGALAAIGTISTTWINTRSLERVTRENNKHDAEQKAEQRKHDAEQKAEQRKHDAEQKAEQRKHDAEQKAEHRKYKENKQKNQFNENEAARQHEREKWTREDQQHSAYDANLKNSSWWKQN